LAAFSATDAATLRVTPVGIAPLDRAFLSGETASAVRALVVFFAFFAAAGFAVFTEAGLEALAATLTEAAFDAVLPFAEAVFVLSAAFFDAALETATRDPDSATDLGLTGVDLPIDFVALLALLFWVVAVTSTLVLLAICIVSLFATHRSRPSCTRTELAMPEGRAAAGIQASHCSTEHR